jgi:translation elongation factor EF-G
VATVPRYRGRIESTEYREEAQTIRARVPQAEVSRFIAALWRETGGRARSSMVLYEYWPVRQPPPGAPDAGVREPRPRVLVGGSGAIALPEPDDDVP